MHVRVTVGNRVGVVALCLCVCERVLLQGAGQEHGLSRFVWEEKMCRCVACVCEGEAVGAGKGELSVFVVSVGLGAAG